MHWLVEMLQHTTSPLTSALTIFFTYKASHMPKMQIYFQAKGILLKHRLFPSKLVEGGSAKKPELIIATRNFSTIRSNASQKRSFSTLRQVTSSTHLLRKSITCRSTNFFASSSKAPQRNTSQLTPSAAAAVASVPHSSDQSIIVVANVVADRDIVTDAAHFAHDTQSIVHWIPTVTSEITGNEVFWSVNKFEELISWCHTNLGMPWWASILSTTLMFRFAVLPLNVSLVRNTARLYMIRPEIYRLNFIMKTGNESEKVQAANDLLTLFKNEKTHPLKNLVSPFLFPPIFLSLFGAVFDLCSHVPELNAGGLAWFTDLSQVDSTGVLPVVSAITWLATIELASGAIFRMPNWMHTATRLFAVAFIPITATLPSGVFIFWITSNVFAAVRAAALRVPAIARLARIPSIERSTKLKGDQY